MQATDPTQLVTELAAALLQGAITTGLAGLCAHLYARYKRPLVWMVCSGVVCVCCALAMHVAVPGHVATRVVVLAPGYHWLDCACAVMGRGRVSQTAKATSAVSAGCAVSAVVVVCRDLCAAQLFVGGNSGSAFPQCCNAVDKLGLLASQPSCWFNGRASPHIRIRIVGLASPRLSVLRAQGALSPWAYYLDICFELLVGAGLFLLVLDDLSRGVRALSALSGDLHHRDASADSFDALLSRPLTLAGVRGSAMYLYGADPNTNDSPNTVAANGVNSGKFVRGAGTCAHWENTTPDAAVNEVLNRMRISQRPQVTVGNGDHPYVVALPVSRGTKLIGALVMTGDLRNPFTALDDTFLVALGQQVGAALEQADLDQQLAVRTKALEQLSMRMVRQHEDERRRLSRELHDETAQVFTAVKMQAEGLRSSLNASATTRLDRLLTLVDTGIRSIRNVTNELRPSLLDNLGLLPALRSLVSDFSERTGLRIALDAPAQLPSLSQEADLALYRALQEALSNVARHAKATVVRVEVRVADEQLQLAVMDDGAGFGFSRDGRVRDVNARMGLTGMQERISAVGGHVAFSNGINGAEVRVTLPVAELEMA